MIRFVHHASAAEAAQDLADQVARDLRSVLSSQPRAVLAVSGGKSPVAFFQALNRAELDWPRVDVTLADERLVPTSHTDSNTRLVREYLLQNKAQAAGWLPLVDDAADGDSLNDTAAALSFARAHFRQPDVLVLGMGSDGHTASLFPQAPQLAEALRADAPPLLHVSPQTAPHERISLSLSAIGRTPHVYLAIGGADKRAVYERAAQGAAEYPVSRVLHLPKLTVYVCCHD